VIRPSSVGVTTWRLPSSNSVTTGVAAASELARNWARPVRNEPLPTGTRSSVIVRAWDPSVMVSIRRVAPVASMVVSVRLSAPAALATTLRPRTAGPPGRATVRAAVSAHAAPSTVAARTAPRPSPANTR
jgi:hypothetical protein